MRNILFLAASLLLAGSVFTGTAQENNEAKKLYNEGNSKLKAGDYKSAVALYDKAIGLEKHQYYYYQRGIALRKAGDEEKAIESFKAAVDVAPKFAPAYNALGSGYFSLRNYDKSIEYFQKALTENPKLGPSKKGLAAAQTAKANDLMKDGEINMAIDFAKGAAETDPKYSTAHLILAQAYNKASKYNEAIAAAETALQNMKTNQKGPAYFEMGLAYRNLGNTQKAISAFNQAKKDPKYARSAEYELNLLQ